MRVTVLGLGNMGSAIARRCLAGGHDVVVWNRTPAKAEPLVTGGARAAIDVGEAAAAADVVVISMRDDAAAEALVERLAAAGVMAPVVNCTTSAPTRTAAMANQVKTYLAAPVLGAPQAVAGGSATYLVAGPEQDHERLQPVWESLSTDVRYCGPDPREASVLKVVSNHLLLAGLVVLSEGVAVAQAAGLDNETVRDLLRRSPMVPPGLHNRLDDVIDGDHTHGWFDTPLSAKDLGLFLELGEEHGTTPVVSALARDRYLQAAAAGLEHLDVAAVVELLRGA